MLLLKGISYNTRYKTVRPSLARMTVCLQGTWMKKNKMMGQETVCCEF